MTALTFFDVMPVVALVSCGLFLDHRSYMVVDAQENIKWQKGPKETMEGEAKVYSAERVAKKEIQFSLSLANEVVLAHQVISTAVDRACSLTYVAFCMLASVRSHVGLLTLTNYTQSIAADKRLTRQAMDELYKKGLIEKEYCENDRRMVCFKETEAGGTALDAGLSASYASLQESIWKDCTDEKVARIVSDFSSVVEKLNGGRQEDISRYQRGITPAYLRSLLVLLRCWSKTVSKQGGLSFAEYRCLALLEQCPALPGQYSGYLSKAAIAQALCLEKKAADVLVGRLRSAGLTAVAAGLMGDKNFKVIELTNQGQACATLLSDELKRVTADFYRHRTCILTD